MTAAPATTCPTPRFLVRAMHAPVAADILRESTASVRTVGASVVERLTHLDRDVVTGRARLTAQMVATACAQVEGRSERDGTDPRWHAVGDFLADAIAGMLQAPISRSASDQPGRRR